MSGFLSWQSLLANIGSGRAEFDIRTAVMEMMISARPGDWFVNANAYLSGYGYQVSENLVVYPVQLYRIPESSD